MKLKIEDMFSKEKSILETINNYEIEIGVISSDSKRKKVIRTEITNAELMFIHENGSPLRSIPARPVLEMTLSYANSTLVKATLDRCVDGIFNKKWSITNVEKELNKLCVRMQSFARKLIYSNDGSLAPNAPSTIRQKGYNHPLFHTGQLARSITCKLVKKSEYK